MSCSRGASFWETQATWRTNKGRTMERQTAEVQQASMAGRRDASKMQGQDKGLTSLSELG